MRSIEQILRELDVPNVGHSEAAEIIRALLDDLWAADVLLLEAMNEECEDTDLGRRMEAHYVAVQARWDWTTARWR